PPPSAISTLSLHDALPILPGRGPCGNRYELRAITAVTPGHTRMEQGFSASEHASFSAGLSLFVDGPVTRVRGPTRHGKLPVMTHNTPLSHRPLYHLADVPRRALTTAQLRAHGVSAAETYEQCRPGGSWQQLLPGVVLLHPAPPTSDERLHAVPMYTARERSTGVPVQPGRDTPPVSPYGETMITALAALTLHGFCGTRSEEHTSELQSRENLVCRLLLEKKNLTQSTARIFTWMK